ncbi:MAG: cell surface protein [Candidatus Hydrogenedentes bacterium]|nr:cell surface protein [Candidatus Hydrogenedentota bacterium]
MNRIRKMECHLFMAFALALTSLMGATRSEAEAFSAPIALVADASAEHVYVAECNSNTIAVLNLAKGTVAGKIALPESPSGLALSQDGTVLYVTNGTPAGKVLCVKIANSEILNAIAVGHTPGAPVISPDGKTLYVCNRYNNDVSVLNIAEGKEIARVRAVREPSAAVITPDGKSLFVANLLPAGPADGDFIAAAVTVIDTASNQVRATTLLPNGSSGVRGICVSADGKYVYVAHILARYQLPTTQLERGWMNTNALTILDAASGAAVNTVLLDDVELGAANPWGVACSADGKYVCVAHAGTHEISVIDRAALHTKLDKVAAGEHVSEVSTTPADVPNDLSFLTGMRRRLSLDGLGPRALLVLGHSAVTAEYFSDTVEIVDIAKDPAPSTKSIALSQGAETTPQRQGEMLFNDARMCFQHWQSCASCHPDARADGLNWDLLNDGIGNPKNTKNMLFTHSTPPVMSRGVRETAEQAVRSGMKFIQFAVRPEEDAVKIDLYLKSLKPVPSPLLENGELSSAAQRGKDIFTKAACNTCHAGVLYTDLKEYEVGTGKGMDEGKPFDTPSLNEVWRTAPYLSDGRAATMLEVLTKFNPDGKHGATQGLTETELSELAAYILSL